MMQTAIFEPLSIAAAVAKVTLGSPSGGAGRSVNRAKEERKVIEKGKADCGLFFFPQLEMQTETQAICRVNTPS